MIRNRLAGAVLAGALLAGTASGGAQAGPTDQADMNVSVARTPTGTVSAPDDIVFTLSIANGGPSSATGVALATLLLYPGGSSTSGAPFRRYDAVPSQGSCPTPGNLEPATPVRCDLGTIASGGVVTVIITIASYRLQGAVVVVAAVTATELDPSPAGNVAAELVQVSGDLV